MASKLRRELAEFPFPLAKLKPTSFRMKIAGLSDPELESRPVRVWVETLDIARVVKLAGAAKVLRVYPHLNFLLIETYAKELAALAASDLVQSVWDDSPLRAEGSFAVAETDQRAPSLATRLNRLQGKGGRRWNWY